MSTATIATPVDRTVAATADRPTYAPIPMRTVMGVEVRKMKDRNNQLMHDAYLVKSLSVDFPWVEQVYKKTCGFIHMSEAHLYSPYNNVDTEAATMQVALTGIDEKLPPETYLDAIATFRAATCAFKDHLAGWIVLKSSPGSTMASIR